MKRATSPLRDGFIERMPTLSPIIRDALSVRLDETSQVGEARRAVVALADRHGFGETRRGELAIIATELATNVVRHGGGGEIVLQVPAYPGHVCIELIALDRGRGIRSVGDAMRDGYSTGSTPGTGLGAVQRLASTFEIYSMPDRGTAVLARLHPDPRPTPSRSDAAMQVGSVCLPMRGEEACGDALLALDASPGRTVLIVADGLGHGPSAAIASQQAIRICRDNVHLPGDQLMQLIHAGMRATRGAAVAIVEIARARGELAFTGVGNVVASVATAIESRTLMSHNGTVGAEARRIQLLRSPWPAHALLIMHSDGLTSRWSVNDYPGLRQRDPTLIAGVLYRDHRRDRDDATVVVARGAKDR